MSNIFLKDCPQCTSSNPVEAVFCRCGYCFDPHQIKNTAESLAHMAHEEEVYLEYLQARILQTQADLDARRVAAERDPENTTRSAELLLATQALSAAEAEYKAQQAKVQALSNHKNAVRFVRQQAKEASDKLQTKKKKRTTQNITRGMKGKKKKTTSLQKGSSRATTPNQPAILKQSPPAPARRAAPPLPKPAPALKRPAPPPVAAKAPVASPPPPPAKPTAAPAPRPAAAAPPRPAAPPKPPVAAPAPPPPVVVRDVDVRKPSAPISAAATVRPVMPAPAPAPAPVARAPEPVAQPRPASSPNTKECPHCTATLPLPAMNCRCGFNFGGVADLPALSLSSSELASILGALGPTSGNR